MQDVLQQLLNIEADLKELESSRFEFIISYRDVFTFAFLSQPIASDEIKKMYKQALLEKQAELQQLLKNKLNENSNI